MFEGLANLVDQITSNPVATTLALLLILALVVIGLFVQDPDRVDKIKAHLLYPFYRFFRVGTAAYLASKVGGTTTRFLQNNLCSLVSSFDAVRVRIKWVRSSKDPILRRDGELILFIRESDDQTLNVLTATRAALPSVVCPSVRSNIEPSHEKAIDLTILKRLAREIGPHAEALLQRRFLMPELGAGDEIKRLFSELVELDNHGIFVTIFLEELNLFGERLYAQGITVDKTKEIEAFLNYLLQFPRRGHQQEIRLRYIERDFRVAVVLVAITARAESEGVVPYVKRVHKELNAGAESIYLFAYQPAIQFLNRITKVLRDDERVWMTKKVLLEIHEADGNDSMGQVVLLTRNAVFVDADFSERVRANDFVVATTVNGKVIDVSPTVCLVDVSGLNGTITRKQCSWRTVVDCGEVLQVGREEEFVIKYIDLEQGAIRLSKRFEDTDPWIVHSPDIPNIDERVTVTMCGRNGSDWICVLRSNGSVEVQLPSSELSWYANDELLQEDLTGRNIDVVVYDRRDEERKVLVSIKRLNADPWPELQAKLPGTEFTGAVIEITDNTLLLQLENGLPAYVSAAEMDLAGFEYSNYQENIPVGTRLHVVVDKVFRNRQIVRVRLQRNVVK